MRFCYMVLFVFCGVSCVGCSFLGISLSGIPDRPEDIAYQDIEFIPKKPERFELQNGLVVYYQFDDEVPLVSAKIFLPGGSLFEPGEYAGLASATGSQMREGGIPGYPPEKLDQTLDDLGATLESSFGDEYGSVGFSCLAEDFEFVFSLFDGLLKSPQFDSKRLFLWKQLVFDSIRRRRDDPGTMAAMAFKDIVYGANSPFSQRASVQSIEKITQGRMKAFHSRFVQPRGARLVVSGAVSRERLEQMLSEYFVNWEGGREPLPSLPEVSQGRKPAIYVLDREFAQATILFGHLGPPRLTPDQFDISIYNRIFGHGGFESMLFSEIRSRLGLAYSVYGGLFPGTVAGVYEIVLGTRSEQAERAVAEVLRLVEESRTRVFSDKQVLDAKKAVERSFVFKFKSSSAVAHRAAVLDLLGYPEDFDEQYIDKLSLVTPESVLGVGAQWVHPEQLAIIIVGRVSPEKLAKEFKGQWDVYRLGFETEPSVLEKITVE